MSSLTMTHAPKGLEGVVATTSKICYIDGERGVLAYRGIDIHELAEQSSFEETCYLLWYGKLPTPNELSESPAATCGRAQAGSRSGGLRTRLKAQPHGCVRNGGFRAGIVRSRGKRRTTTMRNPHKSDSANLADCHDQATYDRLRKGKNIVEPNPSLSHAANFPLML
jgi:citrate synthase